MTMDDEIDPMGNARQMSDFQISNNNNSITTNQNIPWKQRKRKRLSAVLDKLHNNNTITKRYLNELEVINESNNNNNSNHNNNNNNDIDNNQGETSKISSNEIHRSVINKVEGESIKSGGDDEDDRTTIASDDFHSSVESPIVKREIFSSPFDFAVNDENIFNGDIKHEERTNNPYEYTAHNLNEQNLNSMERYFPQISSPLFEYYLQTKYLPDILRMRNLQAQNSEQKLRLTTEQQQQQYLSQSQDGYTKSQQQPTRKRQKLPKQQQQQQYLAFEKQQPPQDAPLDLSMKTILENITKATATHKQTSRMSSSSTSLASTSTAINCWQNQIPQGN